MSEKSLITAASELNSLRDKYVQMLNHWNALCIGANTDEECERANQYGLKVEFAEREYLAARRMYKILVEG